LGIERLCLHPLDPAGVAREAEAILARHRSVGAVPDRTDVAHAVAGVWERFRGMIMQRVDHLDGAALSLLEGSLDPDARRRAEREAHKLAGSVGTFGFAEGSRLARELEHLYASAGDGADALRASDLAVALRRELERTPVASPAPVVELAEGRPVLLVVDADREGAERIAMEAGGRGFDARVATTLQAARDAVRERRPALALVDVDVAGPGDEGLALVHELAEGTSPVPVAVYTARRGFADRVDAARRSAASFLQKPLPAAGVVDAVERVLRRATEVGSCVLAVDDDPQVLAAITALLAPLGTEVQGLEDPLRFWDALERWSPDVLVLDVDMAHLNGIELCRVVRNDPRWTSTPVIFLTARNDPGTVQELFSAGADDYVLKPIVGPELVTRIRNRLERVRLHRTLADTDGLTGVANRRRAQESIAQLLRLGTRQRHPVSLAVLDLDHFKQVNDTAGHAVGDEVLRRIARLLSKTFRGEDVVARWGGEEFVVGLYGMEKEDAVGRLEHVLESFRTLDFSERGDDPLEVTFSAGVAQLPLDGTELNALYRAADEALYLAKEQGRARVLPAGWQDEAQTPVESVDVLVVDDDEALSPLLVHALETRGWSTRWIADGQEAAAQLLGARPSLRARVVLMDVDLPGLDGLGLLRAMAREKVLARTRVIMLTVRSVEEEVVQALEQGAFDHVAKPFSIPVLLQRVRRALGA
ncbi:MAG TPA: response regulator, partial [Longimicrobiaceae bacterium]|nr:response regulator [Longimicrobiaceae bacterium]